MSWLSLFYQCLLDYRVQWENTNWFQDDRYLSALPLKGYEIR